MNARGIAKGQGEFTRRRAADGGQKARVNNLSDSVVTEGQFRINPVYRPRVPARLTRLQGPASATRPDLTFCQLC